MNVSAEHTAEKNLKSGEREAEERKGPIPFYPLFASVFPVLAVYSANLSLVPLAHLGRPLLVVVVVTLLLQGALTLVFREKRRGAAVSAALIGWAWSYAWLTPHLERLWQNREIHLYVAGALAVSVLAFFWRPKPKMLNLVGACITGFSALNIIWLSLAPLAPVQTAAALKSVPALPSGPRPDIFHIILDGFGRQDVLREKMDIDISGFVQNLESRGFQVVGQSRSTYVQTELSVSSTLNMELLQNLLPPEAEKETDRRMLKPLVQQPLVAEKLMASGYRYIGVGSGFDGLWLGEHQLPPRVEGSVTLFEGTLLSRTPWRLATGVFTSQYDVHRENVKGAFAQLEDFAAPTNRPRFVVAHILAPHPPFVLGENGESVRPKGPFGFWDGSDYLTYVGSAEEYKKGYRAKLGYVMKRLSSLIEKLQANGRKPVIILQGDHGSKVGLDQNSKDKTDLVEAFSNFYAVYVPEDIPLKVPEEDTSVNTYRRLLTAMGEENLPPLKPESWYSTAPRPFVFSNVTQNLEK